MEEDAEFVYLALERCDGSLADLIASERGRAALTARNGTPTRLALRLAEHAARGLAALHAAGIVHRDLKPANVLLTGAGGVVGAGAGGSGDSDAGAPTAAAAAAALAAGGAGPVAKVSDMGLSRRLPVGGSTLETATGGGGGGSSGWQAPEQLARRHAVTAGGNTPSTTPPRPPSLGKGVDIFAYGLLLHHMLTAGGHPAGDSYERDFNILQGRLTHRALTASCPEADALVRAATARSPRARPSAAAILAHPLWWSPAQRLAFLSALSDRVEPEDRGVGPSLLLAALQGYAADAFSGGGGGGGVASPGVVGSSSPPSWVDRLPPALTADLTSSRHRRYDPTSLRDLLRAIRNKAAHYRELPAAVAAEVGEPPDAYVSFWTARFPRLILACFAFAVRHCGDDPALAPFVPPAAAGLPLGPEPAPVYEVCGGGGGGAECGDAPALAPPPPPLRPTAQATAPPGTTPPG